MKTTILETKIYWVKNPNTKTTYIKDVEEIQEITKDQHTKATSDETCSWFRRLGGSETRVMGYTPAGYLCTRLTSTSPDRLAKVVRSYKFITE
jgi:hypothetical protein